MLSICLVTQQLGQIISGPGLVAFNLLNGLVKDGQRVTVIAPANQRPPGELPYHFVPVPPPLAGGSQARWISLSLSFGRALARLERQERFDVVHFIDGRESLFSPARAPRVGVVNDTYSAEVQSLAYYRHHYADGLVRWAYYHLVHAAEGRALPGLQVLLANSRYTAGVLARQYRLDSSRLAVWYYGIDAALFAPARQRRAALPDHPPRVLFVGGNMRRKGLPDLIQAARQVRQGLPDCEFWVVGVDPAEAAMQVLCRQQGVEKAFRFLGWKSQAELVDLYARADVFTMPSLIEAFGLVYLEAMAAELPVIGTAVGGVPEIIVNGQNGLLVPAQDPSSLATALLSVLGDAALQARFRQSGLETAHCFSIERMLENTYQAYDQAIKG